MPLGKNQNEAIDVPTGKCQQKPVREIPNIFEKADFSLEGLKKINRTDDPAY